VKNLILRPIYTIRFWFFELFCDKKKAKNLKNEELHDFLNPKKMYSKVAKRAGNVAKILPKLAGNFNGISNTGTEGCRNWS
jgi:hypothetical protein